MYQLCYDSLSVGHMCVYSGTAPAAVVARVYQEHSPQARSPLDRRTNVSVPVAYDSLSVDVFLKPQR